MMEEYILAQLKQTQSEQDILKQRLQTLCDEEARYHTEIADLLEQEDVGKELFSPRNPDQKVQARVTNIRQQLEVLQREENEITEQLGKCEDLREKWEKLLADVHATQDQSTHPEKESHSEEFTELLRRVEQALRLVRTDRGACEQELTNMRYYLMALLSR